MMAYELWKDKCQMSNQNRKTNFNWFIILNFFKKLRKENSHKKTKENSSQHHARKTHYTTGDTHWGDLSFK